MILEFVNSYPELTAFLSSFVAVGLKGFQHKNVNGNHIKAVFFTSYLMACMDVFLINLVVKKGLYLAPYFGSGAAIGMILAMKLHEKTIGKNKTNEVSSNGSNN